MKKIVLFLMGVLLLTGCTNKELVSFYENTKAGGKIDSYQLDLRIFGNFDNKKYSESARIDNYKGTQFKIDYLSKNFEKELIEEPTTQENSKELLPNILMVDNSSYLIDGKKYSKEEGVYKEVDTLLYSNPDAYLKTVAKGKSMQFLSDEKIGENTYKVYTFKVNKEDMKIILEDGVLKDLKLKEEVSSKLWIDKDNRIYKVAYYLIDGKDRLEINASVFRINIINDMSNIIK